jgi:cytochrome c peroxidase
VFGINKEKQRILLKIKRKKITAIYLAFYLFLGSEALAVNCSEKDFNADHFCHKPHEEDNCVVDYYAISPTSNYNMKCACKIRCDSRKVGGKDRQKHQDELLMTELLALPLGLQESFQIPKDNQLTLGKVELGKALFFDKRLSKDQNISCATCHIPELGFTNGLDVATGYGMKKGDRNVPTLYNRIFSNIQFWNARASSLENQVWEPILNPLEMASEESEVLGKINSNDFYKKAFLNVFGSLATKKTVAMAISSFERTLISADSPFDRYQAGDKKVLGKSAIRGIDLFFNKFKCSTCHSGTNFTNEKLSPRCYPNWNSMDNINQSIDSISSNRTLFKTPTLRNVALTGPYMHNGKLKSLKETVEFYNNSLVVTENKEVISKIHMTAAEVDDLVSFLKSLTGRNQKIKSPILPN